MDVVDFHNLTWIIPSDQTFHYILDEWAVKNLSCTRKILDGTLQKVFSGPSELGLRDAKRKLGFFVPCYFDESKLKYPKLSALSSQQQSQYVILMNKFSKLNSPITLPSDQKDMKQYKVLHEQVMAERYEFIQFVKQNQIKERYLLISSDVKKYVDELWKHKLAQVLLYPALYKPVKMVPLVYTDSSNRSVSLKLMDNVHEQGVVPLVIIPKFNKAVKIQTDYSKIAKVAPPDGRDSNKSEIHLQKVPVSEDKTAENLAVKNRADVVISGSALKNIVDNCNPYSRSWNMPITVREYTDSETGQERRLVFVDKALPPLNLTNAEKNLWCYKICVKALFCQQSDERALRLGEVQNEEKYLENIAQDLELCKTNYIDSEADKSKINTTFHPSNNSMSPQEHSDISKISSQFETDTSDSDDKLVIDISDLEKTPAKKMKMTPECKSGTSEGCTSDLEKTPSKKMKTPECKTATLKGHTSDVKKFLANKQKSSLNFKSSSPQTCKRTGNIMTRSKTRLKEKMSIGKKIRGQKPKCLNLNNAKALQNKHNYSNAEELTIPDDSKQRLRNSISKQSHKESHDKGFVSPSSGKNLTYKMWKLFKDENNEKNKETLMKDSTNLQLKILVRCKLDGYETVNGDDQLLHLATKLEHQTEFGAECLTKSETIRELMSLYLRPGAHLLRVRVDVCTEEVLMVERLSLEELSKNSAQQLKCSITTVLQTLYTVLCGLTNLEPGNYLLNHPPQSTFAKLLQCQGDGQYDLHCMYNVDPNSISVSDQFVWNPIDFNVFTPYHKAYNRIPGTFPAGKKKIKKKSKNKKKRAQKLRKRNTK